VRILTPFVLLASVGLLASRGLADTVTFRDGHSVNGSFVGGDARSIRIAVGDRVETYSLGEITRISFGDTTQTAVAPPVLRTPPEPPAAPRQELASPERTIPSGTVFTIRMVDSVDSQRDTVGQTFKASMDEPVTDSAGNTIIQRGADVTVKLVDDKQSGKISGTTILTLDIVSVKVGGREVEIDTTSITQESGSRTARSGKVIGGTAAVGAIIGAIAGGGKGAAIGAGAGAGAGTAVQMSTKGQRVRVPSETRLTFTLQQAVRL
jgi:hypothetical protein